MQGGNDEHMQLKGGNYTKQAQRYPPKLYEAICKGAAREQVFREMGHFLIGSVETVAESLGPVHGRGGNMRRTAQVDGKMNF